MISVDLVTIVLKLILVPIFIAAVTLAGRRWGLTVSGWLIGLPLTSGPVAFFLALEQGSTFASEASQSIMVGIMSVFIFCLVYSWSAARLTVLPSLLLGFGAFLACTYLLQMASLSLATGFALSILVLLVSLQLLPHVHSFNARALNLRWELPASSFRYCARILDHRGCSVAWAATNGAHLPFSSVCRNVGCFHSSVSGQRSGGAAP